MSRGGRGRGQANKSFSKDQLTSLGVGGNDNLPGPVTQPPPLFPLLDHKPISINIEDDAKMKHLLILKQDYIDNMKDSAAYIRMPTNTETAKADYDIKKLVALIPNAKNSFNWAMFPTELRPKVHAKKLKSNVKHKKVKTETDIEEHLDKLEKIENKGSSSVKVKEEVVEDENEEVEIDEDNEDEEMDDGTDYANNYFDNGEGYEDEDDNLDDGPSY